CDDLLVIGNGRLLAARSVESVRAGAGDVSFEIEVKGLDDVAPIAAIPGVNRADVRSTDGPWSCIRCEASSDVREAVFRAVSEAGGSLRRLSTDDYSLDQWVREVLAGGAV
ncbi:MAG: hypothetical protein HOI89_11300, partial [Phycisphaerae bacterium]|nr:hypothetical protein [Phycisphaerae bacterium]